MRIEQLLHGYDNGHRLLAGSVLLKNNADMDLIATMSDWSEYVAAGGESSYITAYPLDDSGYYVIAKTWYADEMKRPGCVWTHSLLIPFDYLNVIDDFKRLNELFQRPEINGSLDAYSHTIEYENRNYSADDYSALTIDRTTVGIVLNAFLNARNSVVCFGAIKDNRSVETMLLAVMNILPFSMLRYVSWCSGSAYQRKIKGQALTCQYLSRGADANSGMNATVEGQWQTYVIDALMRGDVNQGQLIRMFAEDIGESEKSYAAIVTVLYTLEDYAKTGKENDERYKEVLETVGKDFPRKEEGAVIKKLCANTAFSGRYCTDQTFFLYFATLPIDEAFDVTETKIDERWDGFIKNRRREYVPLLGNICKSGSVNSWGESILKTSVDVLSSDEVAEIIKGDFHLFYSITLLNPKMLDRVQWMILTPEEIESILPLILDSRTEGRFTHWSRLFSIMLENGVEISRQLAEKIFANADDATKILLDYVNRDATRYVNNILGKQIEKKPQQVLKWLGSVETITDNVAYAIVNAVVENSMPVRAAGPKLWKPFLGLQFHNLKTEVYTFLFSLSFNWPSDRDAIELMRMAFYPIHVLVANGKLGYSNWIRIAGNLESVMFWEEWDNCKKLRKTIVKRLKRAGYDKSILNGFTPDNALNEQLKKMW